MQRPRPQPFLATVGGSVTLQIVALLALILIVARNPVRCLHLEVERVNHLLLDNAKLHIVHRVNATHTNYALAHMIVKRIDLERPAPQNGQSTVGFIDLNSNCTPTRVPPDCHTFESLLNSLGHQ
uniref:Uncharacterized protein n=1 Tax=Anopheles culicifacies TaxID=139723 RepID=A0A182MQ74_9DIPT